MKFDNVRSTGLNNSGFVLVWALVLMVIVLILGISGIGTSVFNSLISGNSALHKQSFYQADGGTAYSEDLVYQNAICCVTSGGFTKNNGDNLNIPNVNPNPTSYIVVYGSSLTTKLDFSQTIAALTSTLDDSNRQAAYYPQLTIKNSLPHTNLYSQKKFMSGYGHGNLMVSGYLGPARSSISGSYNVYTITTQNIWNNNSQSSVTVQWQLDLGILNGASSSDCLY